jgi:hypothetical protein
MNFYVQKQELLERAKRAEEQALREKNTQAKGLMSALAMLYREMAEELDDNGLFERRVLSSVFAPHFSAMIAARHSERLAEKAHLETSHPCARSVSQLRRGSYHAAQVKPPSFFEERQYVINPGGFMVEAVARRMKDLVEEYRFGVALAQTQVEALREKTLALFAFTQAAKERLESAKEEALRTEAGN